MRQMDTLQQACHSSVPPPGFHTINPSSLFHVCGQRLCRQEKYIIARERNAISDIEKTPVIDKSSIVNKYHIAWLSPQCRQASQSPLQVAGILGRCEVLEICRQGNVVAGIEDM